MNVNNLTNVYNQNPTLQGQYTLQQYLDLYGGSSTGTTTPTTTTTTTPTTNASQGIINANINQFQNQGGGDGGGITTIGSNRINSNNPTFRDPLNEKIANKMRTDNPNLEKYTNKEVISSNPDMFNIKETKTGFIDGVKNTFDDLSGLYQKYSPVGIIGKVIKDRKDFKAAQTKKALEQVAIQKQIKEAEAAAKLKASYTGPQTSNWNAAQHTQSGGGHYSGKNNSGSGPQSGSYGVWGADGGLIKSYFKGGRVGFDRGGPTYSEEDFPVLVSPRRKDGRKPSLSEYDNEYDNSNYKYDDDVVEIPSGKNGGRVGAKDGGSMIQIVKDRLMEKNPAMWGLGYEGLASLQDLITSMPFNQGGIVNIRRR